MEQIETQATDLRYLTQAPVLLSADASPIYEHQGSQGSPGSASVGDNSAHPTYPHPTVSGNSNKRKSMSQSLDDAASAGAKQTRSKRNRYISIAWLVTSHHLPLSRLHYYLTFYLYLTPFTAMNANDAKLNAMARPLAHDVETLTWPVSTRPIAAPPTSKTPRTSSKSPTKSIVYKMRSTG